MAPSVRGSGARISKQQSTLRTFGKVAKPSALNATVKKSLEKAVFDVLIESKQTAPASKSKRKRDADDEVLSDDATLAAQQQLSKRLRVQLLTPPNSAQCTDDECSIACSSRPIIPAKISNKSRPVLTLPEPLQYLLNLHEFFLKAFSIHLAHNGQGTPAEIKSLLETVTKLFKKHAITLTDVQRMLAVYEIDQTICSPKAVLLHNRSPFKLVTSGIGASSRTNVEFNGQRFRENDLQASFKSAVHSIFAQHETHEDCFVHSTIESFPLLKTEVGVQTSIRREAASSLRQELLNLSSQAQNRSLPSLSTLSIKDSDEPQAPQALKARTLSLFDRVKSKQLANSSTSVPAAEAVLRHHAIGRIAEVVDILRMKQQQKKQCSSFLSGDFSNSSKIAGKVSFSLRSLIHEIKNSLAVPMADEELRLCIQILAKEVPGTWLSLFELGSVQSVILNGVGISGVEVRKLLENRK